MAALFHESPTKSEEVNLHIGIANYLMRVISFQNIKITNVQLQIATEHFTKCATSTVSVLIHTGQSNINVEANDDGEYNLKVRI